MPSFLLLSQNVLSSFIWCGCFVVEDRLCETVSKCITAYVQRQFEAYKKARATNILLQSPLWLGLIANMNHTGVTKISTVVLLRGKTATLYSRSRYIRMTSLITKKS